MSAATKLVSKTFLKRASQTMSLIFAPVMLLIQPAFADDPMGTQKIEWSQFGNHTYQPVNHGTTSSSTSSSMPVSIPPSLPSSQSYGSSYQSQGAANSYQPANNEMPEAVRRLTGSGHLPSAMPNPATMPLQGGMNAQQAEHQRVLNNMRAAGYSEDRIKSLEPYTHQAETPGATYRNVMGIKVRNDGMTFGQALNNVETNGLMNTPISTDRHDYSSGTYGYYRATGGKQNYAEWLHGAR